MPEDKPEVEVDIGEDKIAVKLTFKEAIVKVAFPTAVLVAAILYLLQRFVP